MNAIVIPDDARKALKALGARLAGGIREAEEVLGSSLDTYIDRLDDPAVDPREGKIRPCDIIDAGRQGLRGWDAHRFAARRYGVRLPALRIIPRRVYGSPVRRTPRAGRPAARRVTRRARSPGRQPEGDDSALARKREGCA